jgi:hypothetical protein
MGNKDIFDYIYVVVPIDKLITKTSAKSNNTTTANTMMVKIVFFEVFDGVEIVVSKVTFDDCVSTFGDLFFFDIF